MKKKKSTKKDSIYDMPSDKELRARGYMTTDEFVETLVHGLKQYLADNWRWAGEDALHHPSDLASTTTIYTDTVYNVIETFGVQPYEKKGIPWT